MGFDKHVLLIEDDALVRDVMTLLFQSAGFRVTCAANGREALDCLRESEPPFVILLDLAMPVMNGYQFLREQQQDPALARIPVVVISGHMDLTRMDSLPGVAGCFSKPVEFDTLLEAIQVLGKDPRSSCLEG